MFLVVLGCLSLFMDSGGGNSWMVLGCWLLLIDHGAGGCLWMVLHMYGSWSLFVNVGGR